MSLQSLEAAEDYIRGLSRLFTLPITLYAQHPMLRGVIEACGRTWWLMDDGVSAEKRSGRCLTEFVQVFSHFAATATTTVEKRRLKGRIDDFAQLGESLGLKVSRDRKGRLQYVGEARPSSTQLAGLLMDDIGIPRGDNQYRNLAAVSHSNLAGLLRRYQFEISEDSPNMALGRPVVTLGEVAIQCDVAIRCWSVAHGRMVVIAGWDVTGWDRRSLEFRTQAREAVDAYT